jgi:transitional endoplasmic reticulum ATPase
MGRGRQGGAVRYRSRTARVNFYCLRLTVLPTKRTTTARPMNDSVIRSLREALSVSPDNIPLRKHLAQSLMSLGQAAEAESEWQQLLRRQPGDAELMLGLAECYFQSGKYSASIVIIEELVGRRETSAATYLLHARLLLQRGDVQFAVTEYRAAISEDPSVADEELARRLGIDARPAADVSDGRMRSAWDATSDTGEQPEAADRIERPKITFSDVGGMTAVKEDIRMKIIYPLQHADMFRAYGKSIGGGILMYGPPGCGKTHMARATAGEIKAGFMNIGIHDVLDMWIGNSEKQLHQVFETARRSRPSVLFFDEVDALGASRTDMRHSAGRHLINQFLAELDGTDTSNDGVLILAATNAPWSLDSAFRRPGRFDRIVFVPPPDREGRAEILRLLLKGKPVGAIDHDAIAAKTEQFSGADLKAVVDHCVEAKLQQAMKTGRLEPIETRDLQAATKSVRPSTQDWFASAKNYALYSNQSGLYDDILKYLKITK